MSSKKFSERKLNLRMAVRYDGMSCKCCQRLDEEVYNRDKKNLMDLRREYFNSVKNANWSRLSFYITAENKNLLIPFTEALAEIIEPSNDGFFYIRKYKDISQYDGEPVVIWNYPSTKKLLEDIYDYEDVYNCFTLFVKDTLSSTILNKVNLIIGDINHNDFMNKITNLVKKEYTACMAIPFHIEIKDNYFDINIYKGMKDIIDGKCNFDYIKYITP